MTTLTPEDIFNSEYICSAEICKRVNVTRSGLTQAIKRGTFPLPMKLDLGTHIWKRSEIESKLVDWKEKQAKQFPDRY